MQVLGAGKYRYCVVDRPRVITDKHHSWLDQPFETYTQAHRRPDVRMRSLAAARR